MKEIDYVYLVKELGNLSSMALRLKELSLHYAESDSHLSARLSAAHNCIHKELNDLSDYARSKFSDIQYDN
jgi:hypothetical protein